MSASTTFQMPNSFAEIVALCDAANRLASENKQLLAQTNQPTQTAPTVVRASTESAASTTSTTSSRDAMVLLVNAREPAEPNVYYFSSNDAPRYLRRTFQTQKIFQHFFYNDYPYGMNGFVNPDHEKADERAEEVMEYLLAKCRNANELKPGRVHVDVVITIGSV